MWMHFQGHGSFVIQVLAVL